MESRHCTADELIDILYGIGPGGQHAEGCLECAARLAEMRERRRESWTEAAFTDAELADQFRRWRNRVEAVEARPGWSWRLAAATAALVLLTVAIFPRKPPEPVDDAPLFEDAFRKALAVEPASFAPMENLFERSQP
jgi:hypothetical protein